MDIFNGIHHDIFHVLQIGLSGDGESDDDNSMDSDKMDECYDLEYATMSQMISKTRNSTPNLEY